METTDFGKTPTGQTAKLFTLTNQQGMIAKVSNYGAALTELHTPDRNGNLADVTLGFPRLEGYLENAPFFGVVAGRYANRIAGGTFQLAGETFRLAQNDGTNHLHGGTNGFNKKLWEPSSEVSDQAETLHLNYTSPDGEEGYPGKLKIQIDYSLNDDGEFRIDYSATCDRPTPINLTNHAYWNLGGEASGSIGDHILTLNASRYTPTDEALIPTGLISAVEDGPLDFRQPERIGERLHQTGLQPAGYDHNFVLTKTHVGALERAATVYHPPSGRTLEILTTEPGIQLYTANFLDDQIIGKSGKPYGQHHGFCLECQHFPDSPNQAHFPSTILPPGQTYRQTTIHRFTTKSQ